MKFTDLFRNKNNDENINVRAVEDINEQDCGGFALTYYKNLLLSAKHDKLV